MNISNRKFTIIFETSTDEANQILESIDQKTADESDEKKPTKFNKKSLRKKTVF
jgi:hypothetical protein